MNMKNDACAVLAMTLMCQRKPVLAWARNTGKPAARAASTRLYPGQPLSPRMLGKAHTLIAADDEHVVTAELYGCRIRYHQLERRIIEILD